MENMWEKGKKIFKAGALAGAMSLSPESIAQTNGDWTIVSESEVNRRHISESDIQTIDLKNNSEYEIDNSKLAIRFLDKGGHQVHYWINKNPKENNLIVQTKDSSGKIVKSDTIRGFTEVNELGETELVEEKELTDEEMEIKEIMEDKEILKSLEDFNVRFRVSYPWAIDPTKDNKKYEIDIMNFYKNPSKEIEELIACVVVGDIESGKKVSIRKAFNDVSSILTWFNIYGSSKTREALISFIEESKRDGGLSLLKTKQKKIDYIKDLLGNKIKEIIERLPEYEPPVIAEPERMTDEDFENLRREYDTKYEIKVVPHSNNRKIEKEKDINITEKDIEDALDDN